MKPSSSTAETGFPAADRSRTRRTPDLAPTPDVPLPAGGSAVTTSTANQDGGLFVLDFNDPRYLPFEGAGVASSWELALTGSCARSTTPRSRT